MAPFMVLTWEGKSSWAGVRSTKPGRLFVYWVDFTSNGGKGRDRLEAQLPTVDRIDR